MCVLLHLSNRDDPLTVQVICGDSSWEENLEFALKFVNKQGGAQAMLSGNNYTYTRRYFLENLATHDVFGELLSLPSYVSCQVTDYQAASLQGRSPCYLETLIAGGLKV